MTVVQLVDRERARLRRLHVAAGVALAAAATCTVVALGALALGASRWIALPRPVPFLVWVLVAVANVAIVRWTRRRLTTGAARARVAAAIEREQALRTGALRGVIEVADGGALGRHAAEAMGSRLATRKGMLAPALHRGAQRATLSVAAMAAVAAAALVAVTPAFGDGLRAILRPVHAWRGTLLAPIAFRDLPTHVLRGEMLTLDVAAPGRTVVSVAVRATGEGWRTLTAPVDAKGRARVPLGQIRADVAMVASDGRTATDTALVRATDRPFLGAVSMRAIYPGYLGRTPEALAVGEPIRVPRGTRIEIAGRASTELQSVRLTSGPAAVALQSRGRAFDGSLAATASGRWNWSAVATGGPIQDVPLPLDLDVVPDSAPHVEIVSPAVDTIVAPDASVAIQALATDDHGVSRVELRSWRQAGAGGDQPAASERLAADGSTAWRGTGTLELSARGLQQGDVLHVQVVAVDNSPWAQAGQSRELLLRVPTQEERRTMARATADSAVQEAKSAAQAQKALAQKTEDASRDRGQRPAARSGDSQESNAAGRSDQSMSYDAAEKARNVAQEQRALIDRVKSLQQASKALEQQLREAGAMDTSLARQLRDAQQLLRDALTPELMAQMQKLEDATRQLDANQSREAMRDLAAMQQKLREQLEKSAEMLRRAALEGAMETLRDEAKEIADRERQLADSGGAKSSEAERAEAKRLADRSDRFSDELKKLQERLERERAQEGASRTSEARKRADASEEKLRDALQKAEAQAKREQRAGDQSQAKSGDRKSGDAKSGDQKSGDQKSGDQKDGGGQKTADGKQSADGRSARDSSASAGGEQKQGDRSATGRKSGDQQQSGQQSASGQKSESGQKGSQGQEGQQGSEGSQGGMSQSARDAAQQMDRAAQAMQEAREQQVNSWKQELTQELDRAIQESLAMAREESAMEQKLRSGEARGEDVRGQQSAIKQGVDKTAERLGQQGQKTSLLSGRSQRAMAEAKQKVEQATQAVTDQRGQQAANAMGEAADALNRVAASLARDREKANSASSASGFAEMMQQLQELAKKQGGINAQAQGLMPGPNGQVSPGMQATARALARQQRQVADQLDEMGDATGAEKTAQLAREARQLADAMDNARLDAQTVARQQQLFRRLLDAGRTLEKEERDDPNKRESKSAINPDVYAPGTTSANGKSAVRFREPTWDELRGLSADERRAILDYFKRINAPNP